MSSKRVNRFVGKHIADRYSITGEIGVGGMGRVFRAMPFEDPSRDVAIKVILRNRELNSEDLLRFQKEAALMSRLHHPNIICFHELGLLNSDGHDGDNVGGGYYIVMEIANGINLKESLEKDGRKDLAFFLQVGFAITSALDYTHGKNIIHRDIKPQNIVVGTATQDQQSLLVKVLDFGVARLADALHYSPASGEGAAAYHDIAGTPVYMAPEQTHLMDAPIDHRVDLYSLGCVLYEILTGRPPFSASSREKLERHHVFSKPESLTSLRPDIPKIIESIVHKLLMKRPEDRYQSAFALHADLMRVKKMLEQREHPNRIKFPLGSNDSFRSVSSSLELVGRETEFDQLVQSYEEVAQDRGRSRLSSVYGTAGSGKTRLLSEFKGFLAKRKIRFVSADFSKHENALPFNALANGFNDYLLRVLKSQPHEAEELKRRIKTLLGPTAHQVAAIVPGLKPFLSDLEDSTDGEESEWNFQTFSKAFSDFAKCLSSEHHPVVFIFDDLNFADEKSLDLIDLFFSHNNSQKFYMVIGYRDDDPMTSQRFTDFLTKFSKLKRRFQEVHLKALDQTSVQVLSGKMLVSADIKEDLSKYLFDVTGGSPIHLVAIVRSLVSRNLIYVDSVTGKWVYDFAEIRKSDIRYDSVDLVLSRIQGLDSHDRHILEVAATGGMSFQFEMLLIDGVKDSLAVMRSLQRAVEEGFISPVSDDNENKFLGKSYSFTHWRAREEIYQNISEEKRRLLHGEISIRLEEAGADKNTKWLFALTHHINHSLGNGKAVDESQAYRSIQYNIRAGQEAMELQSWQSSQRYFENAYNQIKFWPKESVPRLKESVVVEKLADLAALQKYNRKAIHMLDKLSNSETDPAYLTVIYCKKIRLYLASGMISKARSILNEAITCLPVSQSKVPLGSLLSFVKDTLIDLFPLPFNYHRIYRLLKSTYLSGRRRLDNNRGRYLGELFSIGQSLSLKDRSLRWMFFHQMNMKLAYEDGVSPQASLRFIAERAALFAYFRFYKLSYRVIDKSIEVARSLGLDAELGYLALTRLLFLDYVRDREDEVKIHLKMALKYINKDEERISYGLAIEFQIYRDLLRGDLDKVVKLASSFPDYVQTRNWLSSRAMSMMFLAYLLRDERNEIVRKGESYLKRRKEVAARENDVFTQMIHAIVSFARGDHDKSRDAFQYLIESCLVSKCKDDWMYAFEKDYVHLFLLVFEGIFDQERSDFLLNGVGGERFNEMIHKNTIKSMKSSRSVASLILGRTLEKSDDSNLKVYYDQSLKAAKVNEQNLILVLGYMWFGNYLVKNGYKNRKEYLLKARNYAKQFKMNCLVEYIERSMESCGFGLGSGKPSDNRSGFLQVRQGSYRSRLVFDHADHMYEIVKIDVSLEYAVEESIAILGREYNASRKFLFLCKSPGASIEVIYPYSGAGNLDAVTQYVSPYLNIRSTLFLPTSDAPWSSDYTNDTGYIGNEDMESMNAPSYPSQDLEQTAVLDVGRSISIDTNQATRQSMDANTRRVFSGKTSVVESQRSLKMSALVPVKFDNDVSGVLFLENVDLSQRESVACRTELDTFGAQLGVIASDKRKVGDTSQKINCMLSYSKNGYQLEDCSWLRSWSYGSLATKSSPTWYLGLNLGSDHYLLIYCHLLGDSSDIDKLSALLWYQTQVFRSLVVSSGKGRFEAAELKDDISAHFAGHEFISKLDSISFSFTLFSKEKRTAESGHFGSSRPIVLAQKNQVTPENRVVLNLDNGRDLRYWSVVAPMVGPHAYILTEDSSRLDGSFEHGYYDALSKMLFSTTSKEFHNIIERVILKENLPPYYVGVVMEDEVSPILSKAQ